jgi:hypothetical protein
MVVAVGLFGRPGRALRLLVFVGRVVGTSVLGVKSELDEVAVLLTNRVRNHQKVGDLPERACHQQQGDARREPAQRGRRRLATSLLFALLPGHHWPDK